MSMSKKDFIALADAIREHNAFAAAHPLADLGSELNSPFRSSQIEMLANFCRSQNPHFMRDRWLDYIAGKCGKNGGARK